MSWCNIRTERIFCVDVVIILNAPLCTQLLAACLHGNHSRPSRPGCRVVFQTQPADPQAEQWFPKNQTRYPSSKNQNVYYDKSMQVHVQYNWDITVTHIVLTGCVKSGKYNKF
jgi:hypothetical protein